MTTFGGGKLFCGNKILALVLKSVTMEVKTLQNYILSFMENLFLNFYIFNANAIFKIAPL